ncbi:MAG TPA: AGE family epimerase/isomerase [Chitinophagaceae bacterium]|nr:AGE family epimerase/isomerase [Chitinophagaceae bacterium]
MTIAATSIEQYKAEVSQELENILQYWMKYTPDEINGGFVGKIDHAEKIYREAPKGSVLNSRILWSFSTAYNLTKNPEYLQIAKRAFEYILDYFFDKDYGGVYWTVDYKGNPLDTKKQIYALSFAVYGLSEYYKASNDELAKETAISLYNDIVEHSYDNKYSGYVEALTRDWKEVTDLRLSAKDVNEKKSMNTHLHVLEAFSNLYKVWPDQDLKKRVNELVEIFLDHIISKSTNHLDLFFDDAWNRKSELISYGHDIEAAWLLQDAAETLDGLTLSAVKKRSVDLADAAAEGLDIDGGLWYEYDPVKHHLIKEKHSWPQAEAMVGFFNAFQITGDEKYLKQSLKSWQFVQQNIRDNQCGEWYWGVKADYSVMDEEDKVGIWKCPYHNSRACIEIINRVSSLLNLRKN